MNQTLNVFDIKSANLDLLTLLIKTHDLDALSHALSARFGSGLHAHQSESFVLDLDVLANPHALDLGRLLLILRQWGIRILALRHSDPTIATLASQHGLSYLPSSITPLHELPHTACSSTKTLIIDKPVRAGQQIYAKGSDLIVLKMVSAGAEIIADGNIHVYAPLRGRALAGAHGNITARIFTHSMEAELVSIAGVYRTIERTLPSSIKNKPAQIYLEDERLVIVAIDE